jgi:DNA-binding CsgD family transcriptional regulator
MFALVEPGRPAGVAVSRLDAPMRRLLVAASTGAPLEPTMRSIVHRLGFDSFMYGRLADPRLQRHGRWALWTTHPSEWLALYDRNSYVDIDPRLTHTRACAAPLVWDSVTIQHDVRLRGFLADAARYGIRSGVSVSFRDADHARIVVALNSDVSPVDEIRHTRIARRLGDIMLLATRFHDVFMAPVLQRSSALDPGAVSLSTRELECLRMAAHGLTSADIGVKLGVAPRTIDFHFGNIVAKMGVLNRGEAIARSVASDLIRM